MTKHPRFPIRTPEEVAFAKLRSDMASLRRVDEVLEIDERRERKREAHERRRNEERERERYLAIPDHEKAMLERRKQADRKTLQQRQRDQRQADRDNRRNMNNDPDSDSDSDVLIIEDPPEIIDLLSD